MTSSNSGDIRAKYRYNGLNQRIMWQYDADATDGVEADEKYCIIYDSKWRIVASVKDKGLASPDQAVNVQEAFVYHAAGFAGSGVSSYIDSVILRDTDTNFAWADASDDVLNIRTFYVQNWRSDVMAILDSHGNPLERVRYTAYGTPSSHPIADINGDGGVNSTDQTQWAALLAGGANSAVYAQPDLNADGLFPDRTDEDFFAAQYARVGAGSVFEMNKLSSVASRKGYAGYEWDGSITIWATREGWFDSASGDTTGRPILPGGGPAVPDRLFLPSIFWWDCVDGSSTLEGCLSFGASGGELPTSIGRCKTACFERFSPSIYTPWEEQPDWRDDGIDLHELNLICKKACDGANAGARAWCVNGSPFVCICEESSGDINDRRTGLEFGAQYLKCQKAYERDQWNCGVQAPCAAGYTGAPEEQAASEEEKMLRLCRKADALEKFAGCISRISCPDGPDRESCREERCQQRRSKECHGTALRKACCNPVVGDSAGQCEARAIISRSACGRNINLDCRTEARNGR